MDQLLKRDAEEVELLKDLKYKIEGNIATMAKEKNKIYDDMMKEDSRQGGRNPVSPSVPSNILESSAPNNPQITNHDHTDAGHAIIRVQRDSIRSQRSTEAAPAPPGPSPPHPAVPHTRPTGCTPRVGRHGTDRASPEAGEA